MSELVEELAGELLIDGGADDVCLLLFSLR